MRTLAIMLALLAGCCTDPSSAPDADQSGLPEVETALCGWITKCSLPYPPTREQCVGEIAGTLLPGTIDQGVACAAEIHALTCDESFDPGPACCPFGISQGGCL